MNVGAQSSIELVRFRIGAVRYVLPVTAVAAILDVPAIDTSESDGGRWVGVIRSHQGSIPVTDGVALFGASGQRPSTAKVLVLRVTPPVGVVVDEVLGSRTVSSADVYRIPEAAGSSRQLLVLSAVWDGSSVELCLDLTALIEHLEDNSVTTDSLRPREILVNIDGHIARALEIEIGGSHDRWGIPVETVRHVTRYRMPQPLGRAPDDVLGLLAWQRQPIPLISVSGRLGLENADEESGQVVVIGAAAGSAGPAVAALAVRAVHGIQRVSLQEGDRLHIATGDVMRLLDLNRLLSGGYRGESRATVLVSEPMPSTSIVT